MINLGEYGLLGAEISVQMNILRILYEDADWNDYEMLAQKMVLDKKTVSKTIKEMLEISKEAVNTVLIEKGKGIKFIGDKSVYKKIQLELVQNSFSFNFLLELFLSKEVNITKFSSAFFISESTIRRKMTSFNKELERLDIKIASRKGYAFFKGKETQIRHIAYQFFWRIYRGSFWPFQSVDENLMRDFVIKMLNYADKYTLKEVTTKEWMYVAAINIIRFRNGFQVTEADMPKELIRVNEMFVETRGKYKFSFYETFYIDSLAEINFFMLLLQTKTQTYLQEKVKQDLLSAHESLKTEVFFLYNIFIAETSFPPNVDKNKKNLAEGVILSSAVSSLMFKNFVKTTAGYNQFDYIKKRAPNLIKKSSRIVHNLSVRYPENNILKQEKFLETNWASALALIFGVVAFERSWKVSVQTDLPIHLEALFVDQLNAIFQPFVNVRFMSLLDQQETDIISFRLGTSNIMNEDEDVLLVDISLPLPDMVAIYNKMNEQA